MAVPPMLISQPKGTRIGKLPDFIIIGAMKSGTTAMARMLRRHPEIGMAQKEVHFFDKNFRKGIDWYSNQFPSEGKIFGEKTPRYLSTPQALIHIKQVLPYAKLIILLRDPVDRFFSHYRHTQRLRRKSTNQDKSPEDFLLRRAGHDAIWRGMYATQLQHLFSLFAEDQVIIKSYDQLRKNPAQTIRSVLNFLGVSLHKDLLDANPRESRTFKDSPLANNLAQIYQESNKQLIHQYGLPEVANWCGMQPET